MWCRTYLRENQLGESRLSSIIDLPAAQEAVESIRCSCGCENQIKKIEPGIKCSNCNKVLVEEKQV